MTPKTKIVQLDNTQYQLRKLPADVGSFILLKLLNASMQQAGGSAAATTTAQASDAPEPSGDEIVRALTLKAFFSGLDFESHKFVQQCCMKTVSRMEAVGAQGSASVPIPIMSDSGVWVAQDIEGDLLLVMRLTMEVMAFNLSDFFAGSGFAKLIPAGAQ